MNILLISDIEGEAKRLKDEWDSCVHGSEEGAAQNLKDIPVDLRRIRVHQAGVSGNGRLQIPENELYAGDCVVIDSALTGQRTEQVVKEAKGRIPPGVAVLVLSETEDAQEDAKIFRAGAADCIARKEGCETRLFRAMAREVRYQALHREKEEMRSREDRLRRAVESLPFGVALLARGGTVLSVNRAGLRLFGFAEPGSVVGRAIRDLAAGDEKDRIGQWLDGICAGAALSTKFIGADGKASGVTLWAAKLADQGIQGSAIVLALYSEADAPGREAAQQMLLDYKKRLQDLQNIQSTQKTEWEAALDNEQARRMETERERLRLEASLLEAEERLKGARARFDSERASWEKMKQELENRVREAEERQMAVQAAISDAGDRLTSIEKALLAPEEDRNPGFEIPGPGLAR